MDASRRQLVIDIAGGGPTGLAFALAVQACGIDACLRVFEPRWQYTASGIAWRGSQDGNRRRQQIVTIQSNVWRALPSSVQDALFAAGDYTEVWPCSSDSPEQHGAPRNLPIRTIEDRLLGLLQTLPGVELVPERYDPLTRDHGAHLLAICDGAHSATREHFTPQFGRPHADLYQVEGRTLEETIVGLQVASTISPGAAVLLTAAQNRYLLNTHGNTGFLNVRLARDEAAELATLGRTADDGLPLDALRASTLWPTLREGLRLFGIDEDHLLAARAFRCSLVHRPRFVAEVARGTWGCLLGDAANALHFWPGRGLNTGLKSALSLARCLARRWGGAPLRAADLVEHEGVMQMLQAREVGIRAWQTMLLCDDDGSPAPIDLRIRRGLQAASERGALRGELVARMRELHRRLTHRMPALPHVDAVATRLDALETRTLAVLVASGAWISAEVAGPEVDVAALLPAPAPAAAAAATAAAKVMPLRRAA